MVVERRVPLQANRGSLEMIVEIRWILLACIATRGLVACSNPNPGGDATSDGPDASRADATVGVDATPGADAVQTDALPADVAQSDGPPHDAACVPRCDHAHCGDDGCGGSCGSCASPSATCAGRSLHRTESTCVAMQCVDATVDVTCPLHCGLDGAGVATCAGTNPIGYLDASDRTGLGGWACDPDTSWRATEVHAYFDAPGGTGSLGVRGISADLGSEPGVNAACGGGTSHRYRFATAAATSAGVPPGLHRVWTYGIASASGETNTLLVGSPRTFPAPAASISTGYSSASIRKAINKTGGANGGGYAYAPSIMWDGTQYHLWACNADGVHLGDSIAYTTSRDGIDWAPPTTALFMPSALHDVLEHTCDPSVVRFQPPGDSRTFYYLFFTTDDERRMPPTATGTPTGMHGVNCVARSLTPGGPFADYIGGDPAADANWVVLADTSTQRPFFIQTPAHPNPSAASYGSGEPTIVLRGATLWMWYNDATTAPATEFLTQSTDGVHWTTPIATALVGHSIDIKWDESTQRFVLFDTDAQHTAAVRFIVSTSPDGVAWTAQSASGTLPVWSSEPGVSGDERGNLTGPPILYGFASPYDLATTDNWGHWDLNVVTLDVRWR